METGLGYKINIIHIKWRMLHAIIPCCMDVSLFLHFHPTFMKMFLHLSHIVQTLILHLHKTHTMCLAPPFYEMCNACGQMQNGK